MVMPAPKPVTCKETHRAQRPSRKHRRALGAEAQARRAPRSALGLSGLYALALRPQQTPGHWALGLVIPAGAGCRSTGPPGATTGRARLVGGLTHSGGTLPSARLRGSITLALRPQQIPGHWALGLVIPAGAGCRSTGPPGATTGRARLVGGLTHSSGTLPSAQLRGSIALALRPQQTPGHWALGLVIPAGAGCRSTGPPGANTDRARLVGGLTQSGHPP